AEAATAFVSPFEDRGAEPDALSRGADAYRFDLQSERTAARQAGQQTQLQGPDDGRAVVRLAC
ncbi:hypothetical protein R0J90_21095, partial [Micrococcus sp. SIMBA_144]